MVVAVMEKPPPSWKTRETLRQIDWVEMYARLLYYTWAKHTGRLKRVGLTPKEVVGSAISSVWLGPRAWRSDVDPFVQLCGIVRSMVSNHYRCWQRKHGGDGQTQLVSLDAKEIISFHLGELDAHDPELDVVNFEEIFDLLKGDEVAIAVVKFRIKAPDYSAEAMAAHLDLRTKDIYNANRRIKTKLSKLKPFIVHQKQVGNGTAKLTGSDTVLPQHPTQGKSDD